jgi:3-oxoadipate enol-lactonase
MGQALIASKYDDRFIAVSHARVRVRVEGSGPVLALLHGWALDLDMWTPQFEALTDAYRLVAFDRRGFGLSSGAASIERDVEDLGLLLDILQVERAAVLGMSQGARVALRFALESPERTACVILDGAPALAETQTADLPIERFRDLVRRGGVDAFRNAWRRHPLTQIRSTDLQARALVARMIARYRGDDLQTAEGAAPTIALSELSRLQAPVLLLNGACDSAERLAAAAELAQRLPHAACIQIPGAAHLPNLDQAHSYNEALRSFLQRCALSESNWSERCPRTPAPTTSPRT